MRDANKTYSIELSLLGTNIKDPDKGNRIEEGPSKWWVLRIFPGDGTATKNYLDVSQQTGEVILARLRDSQKNYPQITVESGVMVGLQDLAKETYPFTTSTPTPKDTWMLTSDGVKYALVVLENWTASNIPEAVIKTFPPALDQYLFLKDKDKLDAGIKSLQDALTKIGPPPKTGTDSLLNKIISNEQLKQFESSGEFISEAEILAKLEERVVMLQDEALSLIGGSSERNFKIDLLLTFIDNAEKNPTKDILIDEANGILTVLETFSSDIPSDFLAYKEALESILDELLPDEEELESILLPDEEAKKIENLGKLKDLFKKLKTHLEETRIPDGYGDEHELPGDTPSMGGI